MLSPQVRVRRTEVGTHRYAPSDEHVVCVHSGEPVRVSCQRFASVRTRGEINVFPAGIEEDAWFEDDASDMIDVRLPIPLVRLAAEEMGLDPERAGIRPQCHVRDAQVEHIAWALAAEHDASAPSGLLYRESLGMALAVHLLAHHRAPTVITQGLPQTQLTRVTEYIDAHLTEDVSLHRLSRVAGVSASHLRALFKRSMGVPIHEYVIRRRVDRARTLLQAGDLPASQIALEAGFAHQSHMARCMRRVLGITPAKVARLRH